LRTPEPAGRKGDSRRVKTMSVQRADELSYPFFDGITRHSPEGLWFKDYAERRGFHEAVKWRDSGKPIPAARRRK
jgi:enoyl-CoA hydratase